RVSFAEPRRKDLNPGAPRHDEAQIDLRTSQAEAVSRPFPPLHVSLPPPPLRLSLPPWPSSLSLPPPPLSLSLPAPPQTMSLPPSAFTVSFPPSAEITSAPPVPVSWSAPAVPKTVGVRFAHGSVTLTVKVPFRLPKATSSRLFTVKESVPMNPAFGV